MDTKLGKLIVFEGIDGSGKTTQIKLLSQYLKAQNISFEVLNFPRYEENEFGREIRRYLEGEFGDLSKVDPYKIAQLYAQDRLLAQPLLEQWLEEGKVVLVNRYVSSSKAHLGANLPEEKRAEFFKWIDKLEYQTNQLPKADLTILLSIDPKVGQQNIAGRGPDLHEQNLKHLEEANKIYLELAKVESNWQVINCMENFRLRFPQDIHREIVEVLKIS